MKSNDFYNFGEEIQKIVQSAIDSNDFRQLNETVRQTVGEAVEAVRSGVSQASEGMAKARKAGNTKKSEGPQVHHSAPKTQASYKAREKTQNQYLAVHPSGEIVGTLLTVLGFLIGTFVGIALAVLLIVQFVLDGLPALMIPVGILLLFFILLMFAGFKGHSITSRIKRFRNYCRILNDREFCDIEELWKGQESQRIMSLKMCRK